VKLPEFSKKQTILIGALGGVLLCALILLIVLLTRPAAPAMTDEPDAVPEDEDVEWIGEGVVSLKEQATPPPDLVLTFRTDAEHPFPEDGAVLPLGEAYTIGGTVYSNYPLDNVTVSITCAHNNKEPYPYKKSVHFKESKAGVYTLTDAETDEGASLAALCDFSELLVGTHTLKISASVKGTRAVELFRCTFRVVGENWETIDKEAFPDSYREAMKFFGDEKKFIYRYQWVNGRYIIADPVWEDTYITEIPGYPNGTLWRVHVDAVPYMEKAFDYLNTSYLRVHGSNGDTGVIKAIDLITEYNGCYVSRFTSSLKAISHHTFGTAVDLNASMEPNKNNDKNTKVIDDDVKGHLVYNGILEENGIPYYDFTYDGTYKLDPNGVPQTCVNYLLYELGFFRAGFLWAHYYKSTSDAMHFCLSEHVTYHHEHEKYGLRKVYKYAEPVTEPSAAPTGETPAPTDETPAPSGETPTPTGETPAPTDAAKPSNVTDP
jgi:hypothetical protein